MRPESPESQSNRLGLGRVAAYRMYALYPTLTDAKVATIFNLVCKYFLIYLTLRKFIVLNINNLQGRFLNRPQKPYNADIYTYILNKFDIIVIVN